MVRFFGPAFPNKVLVHVAVMAEAACGVQIFPHSPPLRSKQILVQGRLAGRRHSRQRHSDLSKGTVVSWLGLSRLPNRLRLGRPDIRHCPLVAIRVA